MTIPAISHHTACKCTHKITWRLLHLELWETDFEGISKKIEKKGTKLTEKLTILICFDGFCCYSFKKSHPGYSMFNCSKIHSSVIHTKIITWINFQKMRWSHCAQNLFFRISLNTNFSCWNIVETIQILFFILFVWYFGENYKRKSLINAFINSYRKLSTQTHTHTPIYFDELTLLRKKHEYWNEQVTARASKIK